MELLTIATNVLALTLSIGNPDGTYYNTTSQDEHTTVIERYQEVDGLLQLKSKSTCMYDDAKRILSKEVSNWNKESRQWIPGIRYTYTYNDEGFTVELSRWNSKENNYQPLAKTVYHEEMEDYIVMTQFKWDQNKDTFCQVGDSLLMCPNNVFYANN